MTDIEPSRITERPWPCPAPHPQRPDLACIHPDGHVVHFDGERELWLSPTVADEIALAAAEARGRGAGRAEAIADLRARYVESDGLFLGYASAAAYLEAKGHQP